MIIVIIIVIIIKIAQHHQLSRGWMPTLPCSSNLAAGGGLLDTVPVAFAVLGSHPLRAGLLRRVCVQPEVGRPSHLQAGLPNGVPGVACVRFHLERNRFRAQLLGQRSVGASLPLRGSPLLLGHVCFG